MSANPTMLTPINSIPLKTSQNMNNTEDDTQDPLVQDVLNECSDKLIQAIELDFKPKQFKVILKDSLNSIKSFDYDTEEREFICDYFDQLSKIVSVNFKDNLNKWLYGPLFNTLSKMSAIFKVKEKVVETLYQDCTNCNCKLETQILGKEDGIPETSYFIIQCNNCKEYNLLIYGPNIKGLRCVNYSFVEQLFMTEFTLEQAHIRLEQIKYFRKK